MKHKYKGFKTNPGIAKETKIYELKKTKKIKEILQNAWLFRGHPFVLHKAQWSLKDLFKGSVYTTHQNAFKDRIGYLAPGWQKVL